VPAPRDTDTGGPKRRARARRRRATPKRPSRLPSNFRTEQAAPQRRAPRPAKGPPSPQRTGRATRPQPKPSRPTPRPSSPGRTFEPFRRDQGLDRQRRIVRNRARRAETRLPDHRDIPPVRVLKGGYSRSQAAEVKRIYRSAAKRGGYKSIHELYRAASPTQRRQIRRVGRLVLYGATSEEQGLERQARSRARNRRDTISAGEGSSPLPRKALQAAGLAGPAGIPKVLKAVGLTGLNVGRATFEDPTEVGSTSLRVARESITGIPQGIKQLAENPIEAVEMIVKDYEDRYGDVLENPKKFRERVKSEWGLTPYVFDAAAAAGGGGQALGAVARSSRFARAAAALERGGAPGAGAARRASETLRSERPALRFSGGREGTRQQARSRNLFVGLGQARLDRSRARALEKRRGQGQARALDLEVRSGEVTPKTAGVGRSLREVGATRTFTGRVARDMGGEQSKMRVRLLTHQGRTVNRMRDRIGKLNDQEKIAVREMAELGVRPNKAGLNALRRRLGELEESGNGDSVDAEAIRTILADPDAHLTPRVAEIVDEMRDLQVEAAGRDPRLPSATEILRRLEPQARLLGVKRGPNVEGFRQVLRDIEEEKGVTGLAKYADDLARALPEDRPALAEKMADEVEKQVVAARRDVQTAVRREAVAEAQLKATGRVSTPEIRDARQALAEATLTRDRLSGELKGRRGEGYAVRGVKDGRTFRIEATRENLAKAKGEVKALRQQVRELEANAPVGTEAQRRRAEYARLQPAARRETLQYVESFGKALREVHKKAKAGVDFDPRQLEGADEYAARIRAAAESAGLAEPAYWKAIREGDLEQGRAGSYAVGGGARATGKPKRTEYRLAERGAGERDPEVLVRGVESNIKRRFQYQLVARNIETHAFPWSRNDGRGMTIDEIRWYARENGIDENSIHIQDTRIITRKGEGDVPDDLLEDITADDSGLLTKRWGRPASLKDITSKDYSDLAQNRYLAMPAEVGETLNTAARVFDMQAFRALEIVLKQKPARIMLGLFNIPWLAFQFASNGLLTGLGGALNPLDIYNAKRWFDSLDPEARDAIEAELGITHGHHFAMDQPSRGATDARYVAAWRGFKQTKPMRVMHRMNPLDAMFRVDEWQNNMWRKTLFYNKARKAAYRRMGSNWRGSAQSIDRLMERVFAKPPERRPQAIAQNGQEFEKVARHVKDFLGDYLSFTPAERFTLGRTVMFYGYLRFSLRFVFYTMPVGHPIMTDILSNIGRMGAQEIKELFGVPAGYSLPPSMLAQAYYGDRRDAKRGTLRSVNFGRMNPFLNAITQLEDANQSLGLVSPMYQALADQAFEESSFTGRNWKIKGEPPPHDPSKGYYGSALRLLNPADYAIPGVTEGQPRNRILQRQLLNVLGGVPYRAAEDLLLEPSQSDDALAWSPRPLRYKEEEARRGIARSRREFREQGTWGNLRPSVLPFPAPGLGSGARITAAPKVIEREREKEADEANRSKGKRKKRRRKPSGSRYGGSTSNPYGGGGGNPYGG
jgi:hypothetical protein